MSARPFCSERSRDAGEHLAATASRIEQWLLVEYAGHWPYDPIDAAVFAGRLRDRLDAQLAALGRSRLFLIKRPGRARRGDGVRVYLGRTAERGTRFETVELDHHAQLGELDLTRGLGGERLDHPLFLVCTHGIRDRCCARFGQALCRDLSRVVEPAWVWQSTHVGGDRFAGNVVALPEGLYFGRVGRGETKAVVGAYLDGRIELDSYRGRSCHPFHVQAAELAVRRATGLTGFHDLRVHSAARTGDGTWRVELLAEVSGDVHGVDVRAEEGAAEYLTCKAPEPRRPRRYFAVS